MICPVCKTTDIHELATSCPRCRADLTAFVALESAKEDFVEMARERVDLEGQISKLREDHKQEISLLNKRINKMWLLLLLLPLLHLVCYNKSEATTSISPEVKQSNMTIAPPQ